MSDKGSEGGGGAPRALKVKVKTAKRRTASSTRWLQRQLNDPYVVRSKKDGWRSRAAYKLIEIDDKHHLLKPGNRVVDLGCAPGGWCQVAAQRVKSTDTAPRVVGIDYLEMGGVPGAIFLQKDFLDDDAPAALVAALGGEKADVVLSDMAAPATGHKKTDHLKIIALAEAAREFANEVLAPGGFFLAKLFQGGDSAELLGQLKRDFSSVRNLKPAASRADSSELYVLATGFRRKSEPAGED